MSVRDLRNSITAILQDSALAQSRVGIKVISLRTGEVLYEKDSHLLFHPASNMKLLTTATALKRLGPTYRFETWLAADTSALADSVLNGNLYLKGFGDPDLSTEDLRWMVRQLRAQGVLKITGDLVCDESFLDDYHYGKGWMWDDASSRYFPPIGALTVNQNCVTVTVRPGAKPGDSLQVALAPPTSYVKLENLAVTVDSTDSTRLAEFKVERKWRERENTIVVSGGLTPESAPREVVLEILDPALYSGTLCTELLAEQHIALAGEVTRGVLPDTSRLLVEHLSQPLAYLLTRTNKFPYNNLYAELILKTLGAELEGPPGTARKGTTEIKRFLSEVGADTTKFALADGSGVSRYDLLTPALVVRLLKYMYEDFTVSAEFLASLPIAGVDGTLQHRMQGTAAEGKLRAKTGTLRGVSALSGYTTTGDGEPLAFSMMMQHFVVPTARIRAVQDRIGALLSEFHRRRTIATAGRSRQ
ncbi:MAG: D-alanyl-D-alanine carboxypeptidase/D-alanyl-D-alanine-endopeptidase [Calditrichaeota bacterium]|nr:MAG: D-alanyl-D-alanine carboxypeptidase/D-alanyl-D-alanine-endopeptidase [Calditrichota bacterium]